MSVLKIRDESGNFKEILTIKGDTGPAGADGTITAEQLATIKQEILEAAFPVGTIKTTLNNVNPETSLGFGTWSAYGSGKFLVGVDPDDTDFNRAGRATGNKNLETHSHTFQANTDYVEGDGYGIKLELGYGGSLVSTESAGTGDDGNIPPCIPVYFWRRTR